MPPAVRPETKRRQNLNKHLQTPDRPEEREVPIPKIGGREAPLDTLPRTTEGQLIGFV